MKLTSAATYWGGVGCGIAIGGVDVYVQAFGILLALGCLLFGRRPSQERDT